jgi:hypothetical protein
MNRKTRTFLAAALALAAWAAVDAVGPTAPHAAAAERPACAGLAADARFRGRSASP